MSIKVTVSSNQDSTNRTYPVLRMWGRDTTITSEGEYGPLVVLFTSIGRGIALSGKPPELIGRNEEWIDCDSAKWAPCTITLNSED